MSQKATLSQLRASKTNPRKIEAHKLKQLKKTMARFGDLGGIVRNVAEWCGADGELIGGHQRVEAYRADKDAEVVIERKNHLATKAGTVAEGHILIAGEKFSYREVNWDKKTAKAAMLAANKSAGEWDMTALTAAINELATGDFDMDLTMFDADELAAYLPDANDLATATETNDDYDPTEAADASSETPPVGTVSAQPQGVPAAHIKMVQLFYRAEDHTKFVELTDALKGAYGRDNLSDTIMEAIKRASISAALK